jgi:prepilin-type processing-associated H-X9-DG protein
LLPFIEQQALHDLGQGTEDSDKRDAVTRACTSVVPLYLCPSRRRPKAYRYRRFDLYPLHNTNELSVCTKIDYAANAGDHYIDGPGGPETLTEGDSDAYEWLDQGLLNGVIFQRSEIQLRHIKDGLTHTYLVGEKHLEWRHYKDGEGGGDDQTAFVGYDQDVNRWTAYEGVPNPPVQDQREKKDWARFGSPHPAGCSFVFCDGSVRVVGYDVDGQLHRGCGPRNDGEPSTDR